MIKIYIVYIYIKKVCHYNNWSLKINLFTKVFIKRCVLINFRAYAAFFPKIMYISLLDRNDIFQGVRIR